MARAGGAKLNRTETVTVRLDPQLNYLCELASRAQRRTKSSFMEWAVAEALKNIELPEVTEYDDDFAPHSVTVHEKAAKLWHVDEPDRLIALATTAPSLLTHGEQLIWKLIRECGYLWKGKYDASGEWTWEVRDGAIIRDRLREHWETFKAVAAEDLPKDMLPKWNRHKPPTDDLDDDLPF